MRTAGVLACFLAVCGSGCDEPPASPVDGGGEANPERDAGGTEDAGGIEDGGGTEDGGPGGDAGSEVADRDYSVVVLPDTQFYSASWPDIFQKQARWIVDKRDDLGIAFVLHTGDLVDSDLPAQWQVASNSLHVLDGIVPYVIAAGNHDYSRLADRMGMANVYFPPAGFAPYPWFGGTFEPDHIENSFSLITVGTARWVVISLEFGPRDETLAWADSILKLFRDRPAILITHAFLYHDSTRYDFHVSQNFSPHSYSWIGQMPTTVNDGEEIWQKLILPNRNVKMVFSGHDVNLGDLPPGTTGQLQSRRPDGSVVYQILANYQTCLEAPCTTSYQGTLAHGGNGYLRIVTFMPSAAKIAVKTYSPYIDRWLEDPANQFELEMN